MNKHLSSKRGKYIKSAFLKAYYARGWNITARLKSKGKDRKFINRFYLFTEGYKYFRDVAAYIKDQGEWSLLDADIRRRHEEYEEKLRNGGANKKYDKVKI